MSPDSKANPRPEPNPAITVRSARLGDLPAIIAIEQSAPLAAHWSSDHYKSRIQSQAACFLVAEGPDTNVQGFLCARIIEAAGEWEIENVIVDRNFRRHGIATQLMQFLIQKWENSSGAAILLEVRESNMAARALYERHRLGEAGRRPGYYRDPSEDAILYTRHK